MHSEKVYGQRENEKKNNSDKAVYQMQKGEVRTPAHRFHFVLPIILWKQWNI